MTELANITRFLLNSDYPMDKIVQFSTGNFTLGAFSSGTGTTAHGLPYAPLYLLRWSTSPDFAVSYDEVGITIGELQLSIQTDATSIYFFANNLTGSSVTFYYRIMLMMPSDVDTDALATESVDTFVLSTDYNYTKIFLEGVTNSGTATITHNLGFIPQVEAWYVRASDGRIVHLLDNDVASTNTPRVVHNTNDVIFTPGVVPAASAWHYKIYGDALSV